MVPFQHIPLRSKLSDEFIDRLFHRLLWQRKKQISELNFLHTPRISPMILLQRELAEDTESPFITEYPDQWSEEAVGGWFPRMENRLLFRTHVFRTVREEIAAILGAQGKNRRHSVACEPYDPERDEGPQEFESFPKTDEERERLREHLTGIFFFRALDRNDLGRVIDAMEPRVAKAGDVIIKEGDDGDYFYVIDSGHFEAYVAAQPDRPVMEYKDEGYFGELSLLHNQPRSATVKALKDGALWAVSRETFSKLVIKRAFEKRRRYLALLSGVPEIQPLNEYERMQVADALCPSQLAAGEVLFHEGDEGDGMYFVEEGLLKVTKVSPRGEEELNRVGPEKYVGELALLNNENRSATVTAVEDTKLAFLDRKAFERLLGPCRDILRQRSQSYRRIST